VEIEDDDKVHDENRRNIFKRGVMLFEDFNYKMYNKYILKDPTKSSTGYSDEDEDFTVNEYAITNKL